MKNKIYRVSAVMAVILLLVFSVCSFGVSAKTVADIPETWVKLGIGYNMALSTFGFEGYDNWVYYEVHQKYIDSRGKSRESMSKAVYCSSNPINVNLSTINGMDNLDMYFTGSSASPVYNQNYYRNMEFSDWALENPKTVSPNLWYTVGPGNGFTFEFCNISVLSYGGDVNGSNPDGSPLTPLLPDQDEWIKDLFNWDNKVLIALPRDGFRQSQLNLVSTKFFFKIPATDPNIVKIETLGYLDGIEETTFAKYVTYGGYSYGSFDVFGYVPWEKPNHPITVSVTDREGVVYTDTVRVTCFEGFVDEDSDGRDDRAGDDFWKRNDGGGSGGGSYQETAFDLNSAIGDVSDFFQMLYGVIPGPIMTIVISGVGFLLILGIKRLIL